MIIMKNEQTMPIQTRLSTLWIVVMLQMLFADIFSIMVELVDRDTLRIPGDVKVVMAVAAVVTSIPILMVYLSRTLSGKLNRVANIAAASFTILYIIGGGSAVPHYIIIAAIEVILLGMIILYAWRWKTV